MCYVNSRVRCGLKPQSQHQTAITLVRRLMFDKDVESTPQAKPIGYAPLSSGSYQI